MVRTDINIYFLNDIIKDMSYFVILYKLFYVFLKSLYDKINRLFLLLLTEIDNIIEEIDITEKKFNMNKYANESLKYNDILELEYTDDTVDLFDKLFSS